MLSRLRLTLKFLVCLVASASIVSCHNVLLSNPIGTTATLVNAPFENPDRAVNILLYVEGPPVIIQPRNPERDLNDYTFYNWIYNAFAIFGKDIYLVTGSHAAERSREFGMNTSAIRFGETFLADPGSNVMHLSFYDADFDRLLNMATELGVTHIIRAKLKGISTYDLRNANHFRYFSKSSKMSTSGYMHRTNVEIEIDIYDTTLRKRLFKKTYDFYEETIVLSPYKGQFGHAKGFGTFRKSAVDSILNDIDDRSRRIFLGSDKTSKAEVDYPIKYKLTGDQEWNSVVFDLAPRIESVERTTSHLKFQLGLENNSRQKLTLKMARQRDRISTFMVNANREVFWTTKDSLGSGLRLLPGDKKQFTLEFPHKGGNLDNVNIHTSWIMNSGRRKSLITLTFTEIQTPDNLEGTRN